MRNKPPTGPTHESAKAVVSAGLRCAGAMASLHASSRRHNQTAAEADDQGRLPRRGHAPFRESEIQVALSCLGIVLVLFLAVWGELIATAAVEAVR